MPKVWEEFNAAGDLGLRARGRDFREAFENLLLGACALMADICAVNPREAERLEISAPDRNGLIVDSLNEMIYLLESKGFMAGRVSVEEFGEEESRVWAKIFLSGEKFNPEKHGGGHLLKAATHHNLEIKDGEKCEIGVIFDA